MVNLGLHGRRGRDVSACQVIGDGTGKIELLLDVVPSRTYAIQTSADLINWTAIATRNATNYLLNVTDSAAGVPYRFYRAVQTAP